MKKIISNLRQRVVKGCYKEVKGDDIYYIVTYEDNSFEYIELDEILIELYDQAQIKQQWLLKSA